MPAFDVTANPPTLDGTRGKKQTIVVTATNRLGRPVTARAIAVVDPATAASWVTAPADAQRVFNQPNATQEFQFGFEVPATAKAGNYTVRIDVVDVDLPDDNFGQSPAIAVKVEEFKEIVPPPPPPRWWILVAAAVVVLGVAFGIWKVFFSAKKMPDLVKRPYAEAIAALDTSRFIITRVDTLSQDTTTFVRGVVISQSIPPKTKLEADSNALRLVVQQSYALVPNIVGMVPMAAVKKLANDSLDYREAFDGRPEHTPEEGKIVSTNPAVGSLVPRNTPVTFVVRTFSVPCVGRGCMILANPVELRRIWVTELVKPVPPDSP